MITDGDFFIVDAGNTLQLVVEAEILLVQAEALTIYSDDLLSHSLDIFVLKGNLFLKTSVLCL